MSEERKQRAVEILARMGFKRAGTFDTGEQWTLTDKATDSVVVVTIKGYATYPGWEDQGVWQISSYASVRDKDGPLLEEEDDYRPEIME